MIRPARYFAAWALMAVLSGCASLGLTPAKSLSDRLAYGFATYTAVQTAAANAVIHSELSSADGEAVLKTADQARMLLDSAKALTATDPTAANQNLTLALGLLQELQTYLRGKSS